MIEQYRESRRMVRKGIRTLKRRLREYKMVSEPDEIMISIMESDRKIMESMVRDMSDVIHTLENRITFSDHREHHGHKSVSVDPVVFDSIAQETKWNAETEEILQSEIKIRYLGIIEARMGLLSMKQASTLERWIMEGRPISEIAREDGVSRQAVWVRLFGDRTNRGALRILRHGEAKTYGRKNQGIDQ